MAKLTGMCLARVCLATLLLGAVWHRADAATGRGSRTVATRQQIYAAFTLNLTRFITWPASAFAREDAPFLIGVFPPDPIIPDLEIAIRGESVSGHPIELLRLDSLNEVQRCHVVFLSRGQARQLAVLQRCAGKPILTIGDAPAFLDWGGHVRFVQQPPHIRISISAKNLKASGLEARAQLLRLATPP